MKNFVVGIFFYCLLSLNIFSAELSSFTFGGMSGDCSIADSCKAIDGSILVCGIICGESDLPVGIAPTALLGGKIAPKSAFIAGFSNDLSSIRFFTVLPPGIMLPFCMVQAKSGEIYLGGKAEDTTSLASLPQFKSQLKDGKWNGKAVIARISSDGKNLDWIIKAAPNMEQVTGMAIDINDNLLFTGDTAGKEMAQYVVRIGKDGKSIDFLKGKFTSEKGFEKSWAIYLNEGNEQLREKYYSFYRKGGKDGYDYDGENGKWGKVSFCDLCPRVGGQIAVLPEGDIIVSAGVFFNFKEGSNKAFPAFNLLLARFSNDGEVKWATNLYQEGDSVHTPDQKPRDITYDAKTDSIYLLATQHGSNIYRLKGELRGDTGNMKISWAGKISAKDGKLLNGWYFMNNRHPDEGNKGGYDENGLPRTAPHPKLAGNQLNKIRVGSDGNVYMAGAGSARMWTSQNAFQKWPSELAGGSFPCLVVLDSNLEKYKYATLIMGDHSTKNAGGSFNALILDENKIILAGDTVGNGFQKGKKVSWSGNDDTASNQKAAIAEIKDLKLE